MRTALSAVGAVLGIIVCRFERGSSGEGVVQEFVGDVRWWCWLWWLVFDGTKDGKRRRYMCGGSDIIAGGRNAGPGGDGGSRVVRISRR